MIDGNSWHEEPGALPKQKIIVLGIVHFAMFNQLKGYTEEAVKPSSVLLVRLDVCTVTVVPYLTE